WLPLAGRRRGARAGRRSPCRHAVTGPELLEARLVPSTLSYLAPAGPQPIPDGGTLLSDVVVSDSYTVGDVNVRLDINHPFDADLDISLVGPDGTSVDLASDLGGAGDSYANTLFNDQAVPSVTDGAPPFTGSFRPESPLSVFNGKAAQGI